MLKKVQQAVLFESMGKSDESYKIYESIILKNANEICTALSLVIKLLCKENKFNKAEEYVRCGQKLIETFELGEYQKYSFDFHIATEKKDKEKTIEAIKNLMSSLNSVNDFMKSDLYRHMEFDEPFNIDIDEYKRTTKEVIAKDKALEFIKDDSRLELLLR